MTQVSVNPTDVVFRKSQHEYASLASGAVCDAIAVDNGEVVGYLLLEIQSEDAHLYMKLKDKTEYVVIDNPASLQDAINSLAARLNLSVAWKVMGDELWGSKICTGA